MALVTKNFICGWEQEKIPKVQQKKFHTQAPIKWFAPTNSYPSIHKSICRQFFIFSKEIHGPDKSQRLKRDPQNSINQVQPPQTHNQKLQSPQTQPRSHYNHKSQPKTHHHKPTTKNHSHHKPTTKTHNKKSWPPQSQSHHKPTPETHTHKPLKQRRWSVRSGASWLRRMEVDLLQGWWQWGLSERECEGGESFWEREERRKSFPRKRRERTIKKK